MATEPTKEIAAEETKIRQPNKAPKAKKPLWRRILKGFFILIASIVVLAVLLVVFVHTPWGKAFVRGRVEAKLNDMVNGSVTVGDLDYTFMFGELTLRDVEIRDASGRKVVAFASLSADIDRRSVIAGTPVIHELKLDGVDADVVQFADGKTNLTGLFKPSDRKPMERITVEKLSVSGKAKLTKPDGTTIAVSDIAVAGKLDAQPAAQQLDAAIERIGAKVAIARPNLPDKNLDVALDHITVARRADGIDVGVDAIALGVVGLDGLTAHVGMADGKLVGAQNVKLGKMRVDSKRLADLLGKPMLLDDVAVDATVTGPENALVIHGVVKTRGTQLALDGTADISRPARPSYHLTLVGNGKSADVTVQPLKMPVETDMKLEVTGAGVSPLDMEADVSLAIGKTKVGPYDLDSVVATARADHGAYELKNFEAKGLGFTVGARAKLGADHGVETHLNVTGSPAEAMKVLATAGIAIPRKVPLIEKLDLSLSAKGNLDGAILVEIDRTTIPIAGGSIAVAGTAHVDHDAEGKRIVGDAATTIELRGLDLDQLSALAGRPPKAHGSLSGTIAIERKGTEQHGDYNLAVALREPAISVLAGGRVLKTSASAHAVVVRRSDRAKLATLDAQLPLDQKGLALDGPWRVTLDAAQRSLADIAALLPEHLRAKVPAGDVELHARLAGSPSAPSGTIDLTAKIDALPSPGSSADGSSGPGLGNGPLPTGPATAKVHATIAPTPRGLSIGADIVASDGPHGELAKIAATIATPRPLVAGKLDTARMKAGAVVEATVDLPERDLASLADLRPKLAEFGGRVGGKIVVRGPPTALALDGKIRWHDYGLGDGRPGETTIAITGTPETPSLAIDHAGALAITADVDRRTPDRIAIVAKVHAAPTAIVPILPKFIAAKLDGKLDGKDPGKLQADLVANVALTKGPDGLALDTLDPKGTLEIHGGSVAIPHTERKIDDIHLVVAAEPNAIALTAKAHEGDIEIRDRRIDITGRVALDKVKPQKAELSLRGKDWLVFGGALFGMPDAPRGSADFDLGVVADLTAPVLTVDATVNSLELRNPDRQDRGHFIEQVSPSGDIIYLDKDTVAGKLPYTPVVSEVKPRKAIDARIHIPKAIHVVQAPFDLRAHGEFTVKVRDEGVATRGSLEIDKGSLFLFGTNHDYERGNISWTDEHPNGWMQFAFTRPLPDAARRDLEKSADRTRIGFEGAPTKPKVILSGAGNGGFNEVVSMYTTGHALNAAGPDLPASATVRAPRGDQISVLGFLSGNLPHLLFLDRFTAYGDPYQPSGTYGQIKNVEGEAYSKDRRSRIRTVARPPAPGRSNAEVQLDRLWLDDDRKAAGVGLRAGDRGGGGFAFFFEWSSD